MTDLHEAIDDEEDTCESVLEGPPEGVKKRSMRAAINEMCKSCIWDIHSPGNWRQQCTACAVTKCPLYDFRPVSKPRKVKEEE